MIKILLKKEISQLGLMFFNNKKADKPRGKGTAIAVTVLLAFSYFIMAFAIYAMALYMAEALLTTETSWLYFALFGLVAIIFSLLGSVFSTYSSLYNAKDNELLLSLPIKPLCILSVRIIGIYILNILFVSMVWLPITLCYWVYGNTDLFQIILPLILMLFLTLIATVLSCIFGWVVALIAGKVKSKTLISVVLSIGIFALYYFIYFRMTNILQTIVSNIDNISDAINMWIYPMYILGKGASGNILNSLLFVFISCCLFALCVFVLSKSFISITTTKKSGSKNKYKANQNKSNGVFTALLKREFKRFSSSSIYIMNSSIGVIFMFVIAVLLIIKSQSILSILDSVIGEGLSPAFINTIPACIVCFLASANTITAPSISLEGKNLWIIRSLPLKTFDILRAKEAMHIIIGYIPSAILVIVSGIVFKCSFISIVFSLMLSFIYVLFTADLGLYINLRKNNLDWTNEVVPIKQSFAVFIVMFGGWIASIAIVVGALFATILFSAEIYLFLISVILAGVTFLIRYFIKKKGVKLFEAL